MVVKETDIDCPIKCKLMRTYNSNKINRIREYLKSRENSKNIQQCYIHDNAKDKSFIHEHVCVKSGDYSLTKFEDGNYYCLFHLPTRDKDVSKFEEIFKSRILEVDNKIEENKKLGKSNRKEGTSYKFQYVWFPSEVNLHGKEFKADVFFRYATFARSVELGIAKFRGQAQFSKATFLGVAIFADANFYDGSYFLETVFSSDAYFSNSTFHNSQSNPSAIFFEAKFLKKVYFEETKFFVNTSFKEVLFDGNAYFSKSEFSFSNNKDFENDTVLFSFSRFNKDVYFEDTKFNFGVSFNSAVFGEDSDIIFRRTLFAKYASFRYSTAEGQLRFLDMRQTQETRLNFQETTFEKSNRILFSNASLKPHWFINAKLQKIQFINCKWENLNRFLIGIKDEIRYIKDDLKIDNAEFLLKETISQLAINAEELNRYEDASIFRKNSFETEKYENKKIIKHWFQKGLLTRSQIYCSPLTIDFYRNLKICGKDVLKEIGTLPSVLAYRIYKWLSGYGESWTWAAFVLLMIVFVLFPIAFAFTNFQVSPMAIPLEVIVLNKCQITEAEKKKDKDELIKKSKEVCHEIVHGGLSYWNGVLHSLAAITFQDVEYRKPISGWAEFWTFLERILVPLQAALLALAIRRKFMR